MALLEREKKIVSLLSDNPNISNADIARELDVSAVTVRSDLNRLAEKGIIVRTRGGALPAFHPGILERRKQYDDEKRRIAQAAAGLVKDGDTIMVEAGTTTAMIARYLLGKRDIRIVTNSTLILTHARINPGLHLTMVGGEFRPETESLVGPNALRSLEQFHVSVAFVGTDGFSVASGLTTHLVEGAEIVNKMSAHAEKTVLLADSSKYGKAGFVKVLELSKIDMVITDPGIGANKSEIESCGVECRLA